MIKTLYSMTCGCKKYKEELITNDQALSCPEHNSTVDHVDRHCARCGKEIESRAWASRKVFCEDCYRIMSQARTTYSMHNRPEGFFIDPILWRKTITEIAEDFAINIRFGHGTDIIQIDIPREVQHEMTMVDIDIDKKIQFLKE